MLLLSSRLETVGSDSLGCVSVGGKGARAPGCIPSVELSLVTVLRVPLMTF